MATPCCGVSLMAAGSRGVTVAMPTLRRACRVATLPPVTPARWALWGVRAVSAEVGGAESRPAGADGSEAETSTSTTFKLQLDENELMSSTWEHRAWVWGTSALLAKTFVTGLTGIDSLACGLGVAVAMLAAYVLADFGTGVYHWSVDNYGSGAT